MLLLILCCFLLHLLKCYCLIVIAADYLFLAVIDYSVSKLVFMNQWMIYGTENSSSVYLLEHFKRWATVIARPISHRLH